LAANPIQLNVEEPQIDISEPEDSGLIDLTNASETPDVYKDPAYRRQKAEKFALGIDQDPASVEAQLESTGDLYLRQAQSEKEALKQREEKQRILYEAAGKLNRPLTSKDLEEFDTFSKLSTEADPDTVLEESYGKAFSNLPLMMGGDKSVPKGAMNTIPDAALDGLDAVGQQVAKRETAAENAVR